MPTFDAVYADHHDFVWRNVMRLGLPYDQVDDAVQEVFLVVARKLAQFEGKSSVRTWLFAITIRVCKHLQRGRIRHDRFRRKLGAVERTRSNHTRPDQRSDAARTLHRLLAKLDEGKRHVFILSELEGMTGPEIAQTLNLSLPAVYARLRAAKIALTREVLGNEANSAPSLEQNA